MFIRMLICTVVFFVSTPCISQDEIKLYGGYNQYPGLAFEHNLKTDLTIEIGASFYTKKDGVWHGMEIRDNNLFIHGMLRKYRANKKGNSNFFYGAYLRYWNDNHYAVDAEQQPYSSSLQTLLDSNYRVTHRTNTHKISMGFVIGTKRLITERFTFGANLGIGFSLPFMYWEHTHIYNQGIEKRLIGSDAWIGYFNHLSLLGQLNLGYRLSKK